MFLLDPVAHSVDPGHGMTPIQRRTLTFAVENGYYSIPREITTKAIAREFDVSDQAVTERLRRAIVNLVEHTPLVADLDGIAPRPVSAYR